MTQIMEEETNLSYGLISSAKPLFYFEEKQEDTGICLEEDCVFMIDIGSHNLISNKGAFVTFVPMDQCPNNMILGHDDIFNEAVKQLLHREGDEIAQVSLHCNSKQNRYSLYDDAVKQNKEIFALDQWINNPAVVAKRNSGKLTRDYT